MTTPIPWWTAAGGHGYVAPRPSRGDQVADVRKVASDRYCVKLTNIACADLGVGWDCIDTQTSTDAERISELIARLVAAVRAAESGDA
ncbi:hypothetical protein ACM0AZ_15240 [Mycobacteroides abscessus subsp. massiliense]|uniref:hypothetical protein n=1 Tax=Mycobacteroides abscessus TaxID=36809 RepID=UPI0039EE9361